ncbi:23S rRNA/tRNA pseudouridine synthase A [Defluviimonas sp. 20V17]|uniref:Dual-specificity RNA pseudouridine synthase RluA n=1 Tax=Allgaiera indica TaxID=765699 RepID=A0AAN4UN92_9RHOB|nr:pseudouridine synthase [Allgaiera indica]KDB02752.1 23S rRNA/tRNA pseudouridine synthase A [Defluviimonas sp. 20V17]GHD98725.1 RNA pseudouridine synthase [Allgaiera indica]SDW07572.1 ribosomal large subunit pseudouridine synthase A [Allgaiera indica]
MSDAYDPPQEALRVLHHDHHLLVLDKPPGLLTVPGKGPDLADCLIARAQAVFPEALLVHRLDRDTSGVIVFALTKAAQRDLSLQFETRKTRKIYVARLWGEVAHKTGTVDLPLIVDWPNRPLQHVDHDRGKPAVTDWRVLKHEDGTTRVRLMPQTGRSHQLRVHMKEIGHPILGDPFYADGPARDFPRLMLHAESLRLNHPDGGHGATFKATCPF